MRLLCGDQSETYTSGGMYYGTHNGEGFLQHSPLRHLYLSLQVLLPESVLIKINLFSLLTLAAFILPNTPA